MPEAETTPVGKAGGVVVVAAGGVAAGAGAETMGGGAAGTGAEAAGVGAGVTAQAATVARHATSKKQTAGWRLAIGGIFTELRSSRNSKHEISNLKSKIPSV